MTGIVALISRDVRLAWTGGAAALPVAFYLLVVMLFPFAVGPDPALLARVAGGVLWTAALLAALLPIERLIAPDLDSGFIDQLLVRGWTPAVIAAVKTLAHWLSFTPPVLIASVIGAALLDLPGGALARVLGALAIGAPGLAALAVAVSALVAGMRGASALAGLLTLPLAAPLLIFGAGVVAGEPSAMPLLGSISLLLLAGGPWVAGAAIRAGAG